ncbi:hypothetical protein N7448_008546 [Penicillium atrosanguineum]|uniref:Uncharacterized protein n=1 Tax=Penicillium atrosanguineum TaxID=1132637 RepID=A0A9W9GRE4_9EURO|nr:uncharacterized protein N7443_000438 [Penicillium atrosanguineum]KAJ5127767.1 hypothetical protein N7448_008546 [Penicillium atrosanguineum]KAJ5147976.1 hypothetical protein N7526_001328 [Penicillium atrosanguineum]KAJ5313554.1 hypothetical protein N7443_000438 [Penicillium atrosanguineum]KAJ5330728.1 hypothetical protein N7476_000511 [Penicillium atrosanguineum]
MGQTRTVASYSLVTDLLQQLLDIGADSQLIICCTRTEFLVQLAAAIRSQRADPSTTSRHDLLIPTIGLLANSSRIQLTFCSTLESLRAYLAALGANVKEQPERQTRLVILDTVALHRPTTEFSAQGLSRTFAAAVETSFRAGMDLMLCEVTNSVTPSSDDWGDRLWDARVPLLNGSVRIRGEDGNWGGRGVSVKQIAQRWFDFDEGMPS